MIILSKEQILVFHSQLIEATGGLSVAAGKLDTTDKLK